MFTENDLAQFYGTEYYYKHPFGILLTDGATFLMQNGAGWLVDAVASHQNVAKKLDFQLWELEVREDKTADLTCRPDMGETPIITQHIDYTDFPLDGIKMYLSNNVLMLPNEY